ncbi:MAG TPA: polyprenyl synthetase family protein [Streptosporangiaceae bacterium]|jgi:geranylgeranyl diphosphate synthase type I|nr:polyprenyl synthetase family protein [Streptosporangiaceae bacterium]
MASDQAGLTKIRAEVARALDEFLTRQRAGLAAIGDDMLPWIDTMTGLLGGGKRLRPAFCYWGWRAAGGPDCPQIYTAAAALELLHASALVHDDVMDASDTRRGRPAVHRQFASRLAQAGFGDGADAFGAGAAILIGDVLLSWTDELYHSSGLPPEVLQRGQPVLDAMRTEVAAGQYLDLVNQVTRSDSVESAMRVVRYKTAKYTIERPLHLGAAMAGAGEAVAAVCTDYGIPLGTAFQLRDDILGIFGDPAITGKPVTGDISEGKRTVLMALATERANSAQLRVLDRYVGDRRLTEAGAAEVRAVITDTGALDECETLIDASVKEATAALDGALITEEAREALTELAVLSTARAD